MYLPQGATARTPQSTAGPVPRGGRGAWRGHRDPSCPHPCLRALPVPGGRAAALLRAALGPILHPAPQSALQAFRPRLVIASRNITNCCLSLHQKPEGTAPTWLWPPPGTVRVTEHPCGLQWPGLFLCLHRSTHTHSHLWATLDEAWV